MSALSDATRRCREAKGVRGLLACALRLAAIRGEAAAVGSACSAEIEDARVAIELASVELDTELCRRAPPAAQEVQKTTTTEPSKFILATDLNALPGLAGRLLGQVKLRTGAQLLVQAGTSGALGLIVKNAALVIEAPDVVAFVLACTRALAAPALPRHQAVPAPLTKLTALVKAIDEVRSAPGPHARLLRLLLLETARAAAAQSGVSDEVLREASRVEAEALGLLEEELG